MNYKMTPRFDNVSQLKFLHGYKDLPHNDNRDRGIIRLNFDESECLWRSVKATTGRIFEIGRRHGGSTVLLAAAAGLEREVVSVDLDPKHHEVCQQFFDHKEFGKNIILYIANSIKIVPGNLGLLFIVPYINKTQKINDNRKYPEIFLVIMTSIIRRRKIFQLR